MNDLNFLDPQGHTLIKDEKVTPQIKAKFSFVLG